MTVETTYEHRPQQYRSDIFTVSTGYTKVPGRGSRLSGDKDGQGSDFKAPVRNVENRKDFFFFFSNIYVVKQRGFSSLRVGSRANRWSVGHVLQIVSAYLLKTERTTSYKHLPDRFFLSVFFFFLLFYCISVAATDFKKKKKRTPRRRTRVSVRPYNLIRPIIVIYGDE